MTAKQKDFMKKEYYNLTQQQKLRIMQLWSILRYIASKRMTINYRDLYFYTGLLTPGLTKSLEILLSYCKKKKFPRITTIVVGKNTGVPGAGLSSSIKRMIDEQQRVFNFNWIDRTIPYNIEEKIPKLKKPYFD